ncbi:MAG: SemiSWEET family transporter [Candidatus Pacearchaeota archaeon]
MNIIPSLAIITGALMGMANLPQAYKIFKRKSAKDISIITYLILLIGNIIWVIYGIQIGNIAIMIANSIGIIALGLVNIGWFLYGRGK